jgi:predicted metal-dependent phosphotriesterase family hydrolase
MLMPCSRALGSTEHWGHSTMLSWTTDIQFVHAEALARAVDKLQELQSHDCRTSVDPCPMDLGRDVEFVAEVAQRSGTSRHIRAAPILWWPTAMPR